jgi:hypothetical protein
MTVKEFNIHSLDFNSHNSEKGDNKTLHRHSRVMSITRQPRQGTHDDSNNKISRLQSQVYNRIHNVSGTGFESGRMKVYSIGHEEDEIVEMPTLTVMSRQGGLIEDEGNKVSFARNEIEEESYGGV